MKVGKLQAPKHSAPKEQSKVPWLAEVRKQLALEGLFSTGWGTEAGLGGSSHSQHLD